MISKSIIKTSGKVIFSFFLMAAVCFHAVTAHAQTGMVTTDEINVRTSPSLDGEIVDRLHWGDEVLITYSDDGWTEIYYMGDCYYVCSDYISTSGSAWVDEDSDWDQDDYDYDYDNDYDDDDGEDSNDYYGEESSRSVLRHGRP